MRESAAQIPVVATMIEQRNWTRAGSVQLVVDRIRMTRNLRVRHGGSRGAANGCRVQHVTNLLRAHVHNPRQPNIRTTTSPERRAQ